MNNRSFFAHAMKNHEIKLLKLAGNDRLEIENYLNTLKADGWEILTFNYWDFSDCHTGVAVRGLNHRARPA